MHHFVTFLLSEASSAHAPWTKFLDLLGALRDRCSDFAIMPDGRTLEEHYQCDVKGYPTCIVGSHRPSLRDVDLEAEYLNLWHIWAANNPEILSDLIKAALEKLKP